MKIIENLALYAAVSSIAMAGGYKLPEQSLNSMALGATYVANTNGADKESIPLMPGINDNPILAKAGTFDEGGAILTTLGISYEF